MSIGDYKMALLNNKVLGDIISCEYAINFEQVKEAVLSYEEFLLDLENLCWKDFDIKYPHYARMKAQDLALVEFTRIFGRIEK